MTAENFLNYFKKYYKNSEIVIEVIDFNKEIIIKINDTYNVEINGYLNLDSARFNGYSTWLYNIKSKKLIEHKENIKTIDSLILLLEEYKLQYSEI